MEPESIAKTAFSTKLYEYTRTRMPFGLQNAPATFQRCMNNLLEGFNLKRLYSISRWYKNFFHFFGKTHSIIEKVFQNYEMQI